MGRQHVNARRMAFDLFLLQITPPTTILVLSQQGMFHFRAAAVGNRVFAMLAMFWIVRELWFTLKRLRLPWFFFVFGAYLLFCTILGVMNGNAWGDIVVDLFLLMLPLGFALGGRRVALQGEDGLGEVSRHFFLYNLVYFLIITLPALYILKLPMALPDIGCLVAGFMAMFASPAFGSLWGGVGVGILFLGSGYKNVLLQAISDLLVGSSRYLRDGRGVIFRIFFLLFVMVFLIGFVTFNGQQGSIAVNQVLGSKVRSFAVSVVNFIKHPNQSWNKPFTYLDLSTGERIYELHQVIDTLKASPVKLIVGQGLGGTVDLSETKDPGVYRSHEDLQHVRVVHLGVSWALLKGGFIGLGLYLGWLVKIFYNGVLSWRKNKAWWWITLHLALLNYALGTFVVFGFWLRQPFFGFALGALSGLHQIKRRNLSWKEGV